MNYQYYKEKRYVRNIILDNSRSIYRLELPPTAICKRHSSQILAKVY